MNYSEIIKSLNDKKFNHIYFLTGEEPFYIDKISDHIINRILKPEERSFNQTILYGKDTSVEEILLEAKQFPLLGNKRTVIVKEAQNIRNIEQLEAYFIEPQPSTILVICYKGKTLDKRKKFSKIVAEKCILFESRRLYENQITTWIQDYLKEKGYSADYKSCELLKEALGKNLSNISNELNKLMLILVENKAINPTLIEKHIGISKDFNVFELQEALAQKNEYKCYYILNYILLDQKNNPIEKMIGSLFSFFQKVITFHSLKNKNDAPSILKINPYFITQYKNAAEKYNYNQLTKIFGLLKDYDLKSKGVNNTSTSRGELMRELISKMIHI